MTQNELKEKLHYNPKTGIFTHLKSHRNTKAGSIAGHADKTNGGYIKLHAENGKYIYAHRAAYLYMIGSMPEKEIDHINHNRIDNSWDNLRIVDHPTNGKNQRKYSNNTSGFTGIQLRLNGKYQARIYHKAEHIDLGSFITIEEAIFARKTALLKYKFHRNHGL